MVSIPAVHSSRVFQQGIPTVFQQNIPAMLSRLLHAPVTRNYHLTITIAHNRGKYKEVLRETERMMRLVDTWSADDLNNRQEVQASLHSSAGNAYLELGNYESALSEHQQDLEIASSL